MFDSYNKVIAQKGKVGTVTDEILLKTAIPCVKVRHVKWAQWAWGAIGK